MKSEEKSILAISAQAHSEAADNRLLRKKLQARDKRVVELEAMVSNLNKQLCEKVDQLNDMMQSKYLLPLHPESRKLKLVNGC